MPTIRAKSSQLLSMATLLSIAAALPAQAQGTAGQAEQAASQDGESEEVVVFGSRNPQKVAREVQENAPNLVNVQSQQEIEKYPDVSTAEALSRIPGVSLETDTGEGRFVNIRGLDADLNGTTFGGVRLPASSPASPFGGGRAVAFDAIPAGFVGTFAVTKSLTPDMDAEGLGGQIEITPKMPLPNEAPFAEGLLGAGVEPLRNTPLVQGDLTVGGSFGFDSGPWDEGGDKPFSILATGDTYEDQRGIDDVEESYTDDQAHGKPDKLFSDLQLRRYLYHRRRYGYGGEFDFRPSDTTSLYFRYAESGYTEDQDKQFLVYNGLDSGNGSGLPGAAGFIDPSNPNGFIAKGATLATTTTDAVETLRNRVIAFGGATRFDNGMVLDYRGSFADGSYHQVQNYGAEFDSKPVTVSYNNITDPNHPLAQVPGFNVTNPANYTLNSLNNSSQENTDGEWAGAVNLAIPLDLLDGTGTFKLGGSVRLRLKSVDQQNEIFNVSGLPDLTLANFDYGGTKHTYYDGRYTLPTQPNLKQIRALFLQYPGLVSEDVGSDLGAFERDSENVYAGYFQYSWSQGPWGVLTGMRFEQTDANYGSYTQTTDASGNNTTFTFTNHPTSYFDYFPSVQGRYQVAPDLIARLAYSTAIARPGFNQISGATQVDLNAGTVDSGNPKLQPTTVDNFDASVEWYLPDAGILSLGLFDKEFHNYIFTRTTFGAYPGIVGRAMFTNYVNAGSGQAYGAEFDYHQKFDFLPPVLDGFGVDVNYTYVSSSAEVRPGETEPLPSTAQHTINAAIFYENHGLEMRLALDYVGQNLFGIGNDRSTDVFSRPRAVLDVSTQYQFDENFKVYLNVKNLTNEPLEFVEGGSANRPIQREFYDVTIQSGIKFQFGRGIVHAETSAETAYTPPPPMAPAAMARSYMVFFDFNKSDLAPQATQIVDLAANNAAPAKVTQITVTGHTDTVGSDAYNMRLSRRRAESVAARLEKDGIPSSEIAIVAKGKRDLLVPTGDGVKEPQNRRVQIVYDGGVNS
jgi:TonB-dependent receptor